MRVSRDIWSKGAALKGAAVALFALFLLWFATPWPTQLARYAWRHWRVPELALVLDRTDAPLAMEIGNSYFGATVIGSSAQKFDPALAKWAFTHALMIEPGVLWGHYSLARFAFDKSDFETALAEINQELAANPENLRALYVRGLIYGYRVLPNDLALAQSDFERFTQWAPTEWAGYNDLAWILEKEGKYEEAAAVMQRAFTNVPGGRLNPWLLNELGVAELNVGEDAKAKVSFGAALSAAQALSPLDWRKAYTGNDPATDRSGEAAFIQAISANLSAAEGGQAATTTPAL